jgi:hypothetical protein
MANAGRKLPYAFLLLLALAAGVLSIVVLQKVREQRIFAGRLQERDRQLVSLRILLQVWSLITASTPDTCTGHFLGSSLFFQETMQQTRLLKEKEANHEQELPAIICR